MALSRTSASATVLAKQMRWLGTHGPTDSRQRRLRLVGTAAQAGIFALHEDCRARSEPIAFRGTPGKPRKIMLPDLSKEVLTKVLQLILWSSTRRGSSHGVQTTEGLFPALSERCRLYMPATVPNMPLNECSDALTPYLRHSITSRVIILFAFPHNPNPHHKTIIVGTHGKDHHQNHHLPKNRSKKKEYEELNAYLAPCVYQLLLSYRA